MSHETSDPDRTASERNRDQSSPSGSRRRRECGPWFVSGFGGLSVCVLVAWWFAFPDQHTATGFALSIVSTGIPSLGLGWGGVRLARSDVDAHRYARVCKWCFGGAIGFLAINLPTMIVFPWYDLAGTISWAHFAVTTGAVGGFAVGYVEARAIQREVEATAATVRANQLEDERELLTYLNDLLRHEVLNSAQIIGGHATLLREECDDDRVRDRLTTIERKSDDLIDVIEDVRAMLNANRGPETAAVVDLTDVIEDQVAAYRARFGDAVFKTELPDSAPVSGNEGLTWVFANLLENAIEHNDSESPRVRVTVETASAAETKPETGTVTVTIADNGSGIPEKTRETLFERKSKNHGLGLYLSRILADRYGGTVELDETGPDGSVFVVTLPHASPDADEPDERDEFETAI